MYIITFYSFKGGVGRTMALVNTGADLARRGRKVLLVDFDLEAPGLSTSDLLRPTRPHPGIVEFVTEFRNTRHSPLVTEFLYEIGPKSKEAIKQAKLIAKKGGKLWVMPAGKGEGDAEYRRKLLALNWRTLYQEEEGFLLFEDTRLQWEAELQPDYVLIDAHSGRTDIEGICTRQLADAVVVVFYPNEQNRVGLREVCGHIRAEETSGLKKKITLHFVASSVPNMSDKDLRLQLKPFKRIVRENARILVIHREETLQMLEQPVFVLERPDTRLAYEYKRLVRSLIVENPVYREEALLYLQDLKRLQDKITDEPNTVTSYSPSFQNVDPSQCRTIPRQDRYDNYGEVIKRLNQIASRFYNDVDIQLRIAQWYLREGLWESALRQFDTALQLRSNRNAFLHRSDCRLQLGNITGAIQDLMQVLITTPMPEKIINDSMLVEVWLSIAALSKLLSHSYQEFRQALALPNVRGNPLLLECGIVTLTIQLFQQRDWKSIISYLEIDVPQLLRSIPSESFPVPDTYLTPLLAIAYWGETGHLRPDLCQNVLDSLPSEWRELLQSNSSSSTNQQCQFSLLPPTGSFRKSNSQSSNRQQADSLQCLSLLYWGIGDKEKAVAVIDRASAILDEGPAFFDLSYWTFQKATVHDFRKHCEEQRRMIHGEPIRPPFLGPPS